MRQRLFLSSIMFLSLFLGIFSPPSPFLQAFARVRLDPASGIGKRTMTLNWSSPFPAGTPGLSPAFSPLGYLLQRRAPGGNQFTYTEINPNGHAYRVKFVKGSDESPYSPATLRLSTAGFVLTPHSQFLPIIVRK